MYIVQLYNCTMYSINNLCITCELTGRQSLDLTSDSLSGSTWEKTVSK